jgi:hypothetical protein
MGLDFELLFRQECINGNLTNAKLHFNDIPYKLYNIKPTIIDTFSNGHLDVVEWLFTINVQNIVDTFHYACVHRYSDLVQWILPKVSQDDINCEFEHAFIHDHLDIATLLIPTQEQIYIDKYFISACSTNKLELVKLLVPICTNIKIGFIKACAYGRLNVVKELLSFDSSLNINESDYVFFDGYSRYNNMFDILCDDGDLNMIKWLWYTFKPDPNTVFMNSYKDLKIVTWLLSECSEIDVYANNNSFINSACIHNCTDTVTWICENYYKSYSYIKFDEYSEFESEIKDILIEYNLIDPSTLDEHDLDYYLQKTNGFVPQGFVNQYNKPVKIRGHHTKPALRE